jgi:MerR family transcriptional regulator, copper efflux regulator
MTSGLLRIGEVAARAGVTTRTVDFYTGLGLLVPARRSGGNFRLYRPADVQRIAAIRHLEAQGIRLEDISHMLSASAHDDHTGCVELSGGPCPADPVALGAYLASLDAKVLALHGVAEGADPETRSVLATLTMRAQALIATALILAGEIVQGADILPPL